MSFKRVDNEAARIGVQVFRFSKGFLFEILVRNISNLPEPSLNQLKFYRPICCATTRITKVTLSLRLLLAK